MNETAFKENVVFVKMPASVELLTSKTNSHWLLSQDLLGAELGIDDNEGSFDIEGCEDGAPLLLGESDGALDADGFGVVVGSSLKVGTWDGRVEAEGEPDG